MPPTGPIALEVESVTVRFGALAALSDVSLGVESGTIHAIVGPNGAGKSTLLNVVSGLFRPSQGRVSVLGTEVTAAPPHLVAALGVARSFQNVSAAGTDTVFENLMLGRHRLIRSGLVATGLRLARARREEQAHAARVREIAEFMDLTAHLDKPVGSLPYGDQKRVDLARAICMEPSLLLLDEPAAGLDAAETAAIADIVVSLRETLDITVALIEHDMGMVMSISDHVSVLDFGRLIRTGTPAQVQADPAVADAYLRVGNTKAVLQP